jgi:general secretion pathway protein N
MKRWQLFAVGIVAYILILIATVPATLVDTVLRRVSEGRLRLAEARGRVWSGGGQIEILDAGRQAGITKTLAWHLLPGSLLRGHLVCEVELESSTKPFQVKIFLTRIELVDTDISMPATMLGIAVPKLAPFGLGGNLLLHVTDLLIGSSGVQGNATVHWRAASSAHTPVSPLGDYELRFENSGTAMKATLRTLDGPLQLDGTGSWAHGASPAFNATARVSPRQREQIEPFLRMIAVERGAGNFELQLQ